MPVVTKEALLKLKVGRLREICDEFEISKQGTKAQLADRILETSPEYQLESENESSDDETDGDGVVNGIPQLVSNGASGESSSENTSETVSMLMLMMKQQFEQSNKQHELIQQLLLKQTESQGTNNNSSSTLSLDSVGSDSKRINDRLNWYFNDIELKISEVDSETATSLGSFVYKESLKQLINTKEKLNVFIGEKSQHLSDGDTESVSSRFTNICKMIQNRKSQIMQLVKIEEKKGGSLPSGIAPPQFFGDTNSFPVWWESFDALIHSNSKVSPFYKYRYLRQCMKGQASQCLDSFSPLTEFYTEALEHVKTRFGQPRKVVRHVMKNIVEMKPFSSSDPQELRKDYDSILGKLHTLSKYSEKLDNPVDALVLPILESKLTNELKQSWEKELIDNCSDDEFGTLDRYADWFSREVRARETLIEAKPTYRNVPSSSKKPKGLDGNKVTSAQALTTGVAGNNTNDVPFCVRCSKRGHKIQDCSVFCKDAVNKRWDLAKQQKLCYKCLETFHRGTSCSGSCTIDNCSKRHHTLLHFVTQTSSTTTNVEDNSASPNTQALNSKVKSLGSSPCQANYKTNNNVQMVMPSAVVIIHGQYGKSKLVRVAFDSMCQDSFVRENIAKEMGLNCDNKAQVQVNGFGETVSTLATARVSFALSRPNGAEVFPVDALVYKGNICSALDPIELDWSKCEHLHSLNISDTIPRSPTDVDILVGLNHFLKLVTGKMVRHTSDAYLPAALETVFGYVLMGPNREPNKRGTKQFKTNCMVTGICGQTTLERAVERFWTLESIGITDRDKVQTTSEKQAQKQFDESISFDGERYSVALPFRPDAPEITNNYQTAAKQLAAIERRLKRNPKAAETYQTAINDYEKLGFARKATQGEIAEFENGPQYFIPHHPIVKEDRVTTKTRVVFNASCADPKGNSLNDCLLPGPALQSDLGKILIRFRTHKFVLMGDIAKMFCQTKIDPRHYRYQQYLWRDFDTDALPVHYIMERVMFGVKPSPFLAMGSVFHHAKQDNMVQKYPIACQQMDDFYVDDYCGGGQTPEEVITIASQLKSLLAEGGWHLTKFVSNSPMVMESIPEADRLLKSFINFDDNDDCGFTKALGIGWNVALDEFIFKASDELMTPLSKVTKRSVLSKVSQIYDVFGFYAPYTVRAKMIIQSFWDIQATWDEQLSGKVVDDYKAWETELPDLGSIQIPRLMVSNVGQTHDLFVFADASEKAYGAVIYIRSVGQNDDATVQFVMAKARVAPRKSKSLARLELLAIVLAVRLVKYVNEALASFVFGRIQFFTDSTIALSWINKPSSHWKTFVANRVQEIHDEFTPEQFRHVPGRENPADLLSRGLKLSELNTDNTFYWNGPTWLHGPDSGWPTITEAFSGNTVSEAEVKKVNVMKATTTEDILLSRYNDYTTVRRVLAQMLKWKKVVTRTTDGSLSSESLQKAENLLLRNAQQRHFPEEYGLLSNNKPISSQSSLLSLNPQFDHDRKLIIVGGRLNFSNLPEEAKHQVILPHNDRLTELITMQYHIVHSHAPIETTLALLRQRFWITSGRRVVRKAVHECLTCKHSNTTPMQQQMGPLPPERTVIAPAFTNVGLDFTGPLFVKSEKGEAAKMYICLFTCMQSRMVHLELTRSMETEEFLLALRRMTNRRGLCKVIFSDNFTSFKKAKKLLQSDKVKRFISEQSVDWKFITERSPFRGGFYERLNRSLKTSLKKVLGKALLSYVELYTILTDVECAINQRPLTYQGADPKDLQPISPAHLALGRSLNSLPNVNTKEVDVNVRYKYIQRLQSHFWKRWIKEYLPNLQIRKKWQEVSPEIAVDDVCLISEDNVPRNKWPMGRVTEVFCGKDGIVRTARLQTKNSSYVRPVQRLHLLEKSPTEVGTSTSPNISTDTPAPDSLRGITSQGEEDVPYYTRYGRRRIIASRFAGSR